MTTAMATHQESIHERLQPVPEESLYLHHAPTAWPSESDDHRDEHGQDPYYNMPKRNKRKNFKPRCAPNATSYSDESGAENCQEATSPINGVDRTSPEDVEDDTESKNGAEENRNFMKIGVKNLSFLKGGAVDLSRRLSTDSNENIDSNYRLPDEKKVESFQRSYIDSLQINQDSDNRDQTVLNFSNLQNAKSFCAKNPFAISQLIKTNSPPRRRESDFSDEGDDKGSQDINANERLEVHDPREIGEVQQNGDSNNAANRILRDYAMNTMKELLGIYGLSSNEVADAISGQIRALEALQGKTICSGLEIDIDIFNNNEIFLGKPFSHLPLSLKRRHDSGDENERSLRRSSSATEDEGSTNITPPKTPDNDVEAQRYYLFSI